MLRSNSKQSRGIHVVKPEARKRKAQGSAVTAASTWRHLVNEQAQHSRQTHKRRLKGAEATRYCISCIRCCLMIHTFLSCQKLQPHRRKKQTYNHRMPRCLFCVTVRRHTVKKSIQTPRTTQPGHPSVTGKDQ